MSAGGESGEDEDQHSNADSGSTETHVDDGDEVRNSGMEIVVDTGSKKCRRLKKCYESRRCRRSKTASKFVEMLGTFHVILEFSRQHKALLCSSVCSMQPICRITSPFSIPFTRL